MFRSEASNMVPCYGISQDPEGNYIMVMEYMKDGNLKEYLKNNYRELDFKDKLKYLKEIARGLKDIHHKKLIHRDFHSGNVIVDKNNIDKHITCRITDLGLCQPVDETDQDKVYGVMPYVAPEVLRNKPYTQASDIYSFSMIMYEILTGYPPYYKCVHDEFLGLKICQGERPKFPIKIPPLLADLIIKC